MRYVNWIGLSYHNATGAVVIVSVVVRIYIYEVYTYLNIFNFMCNLILKIYKYRITLTLR